MKELLFLVATSTGLLVAQETVAPSPYASWVQGGAAVVICGLFCYMLIYGLPQLEQKHREAMAAQQAEFVATVDKLADRFERMEKIRDARDGELNTTLQAMIANCAENRKYVSSGKSPTV